MYTRSREDSQGSTASGDTKEFWEEGNVRFVAQLFGAIALYWCSGFTTALTSDDSGSSSISNAYPSCAGTIDTISDGACDVDNNNAGCGYDGGDCCACTCVGSDDFVCSLELNCEDPYPDCTGTLVGYASSGNIASSSNDTDINGCNLPWIEDGYCDEINNIEVCGYDGGDCCECTCLEGEFDCSNGFDCVDPGVECTGTTTDDATSRGNTVPVGDDDRCMWVSISDGYCDTDNNNEECGYDGGDCCECSCVETAKFNCPEGKFDCIDPDPHCTDGSEGGSYTGEDTSSATGAAEDLDNTSDEDEKWLDAAWEIVVTVMASACTAAVLGVAACMKKRSSRLSVVDDPELSMAPIGSKTRKGMSLLPNTAG